MQNIIDETHGRLKKFLSGSKIEEKEVGAAAFYGGNGEKLINKIPPQNYGKLDKFAPISWL
ncbi:MAG: hypothetical protein AAB739_01180 [Patescibacteria group bacterium]